MSGGNCIRKVSMVLCGFFRWMAWHCLRTNGKSFLCIILSSFCC